MTRQAVGPWPALVLINGTWETRAVVGFNATSLEFIIVDDKGHLDIFDGGTDEIKLVSGKIQDALIEAELWLGS